MAHHDRAKKTKWHGHGMTATLRRNFFFLLAAKVKKESLSLMKLQSRGKASGRLGEEIKIHQPWITKFSAGKSTLLIGGCACEFETPTSQGVYYFLSPKALV